MAAQHNNRWKPNFQLYDLDQLLTDYENTTGELIVIGKGYWKLHKIVWNIVPNSVKPWLEKVEGKIFSKKVIQNFINKVIFLKLKALRVERAGAAVEIGQTRGCSPGISFPK